MAHGRPWYKRRGGDFLMRTLSFPDSDHRWAYSAITDMLNERDRPFADEPSFICGFTGLGKRRWTAVRAWLVDNGFVLVTPAGDLTTPEFEREHAGRVQYRAQQSEHGRRAHEQSGDQSELNFPERDAEDNENNDLAAGLPEGTPSLRVRAGARARTDGPVSAEKHAEKLSKNSGKTKDNFEPSRSTLNNSNDLAQGLPQASRAREEGRDKRKKEEDSQTHPTLRDSRLAGEAESGNDNLLQNADLLTIYEAVCDAAGFQPVSPGRIARAQDEVKKWRDHGYDFDRIVIPAIRKAMAASNERTRTLGRFRDALAHDHARLTARAANGSAAPPATPVLKPPDEDPRFQPFRQALLDQLGDQLFNLLVNRVRFEAIEVSESFADKPRLRVNGPTYLVDNVIHGRNAPLVRRIAKAHGFEELWK